MANWFNYETTSIFSCSTTTRRYLNGNYKQSALDKQTISIKFIKRAALLQLNISFYPYFFIISNLRFDLSLAHDNDAIMHETLLKISNTGKSHQYYVIHAKYVGIFFIVSLTTRSLLISFFITSKLSKQYKHTMKARLLLSKKKWNKRNVFRAKSNIII